MSPRLLPAIKDPTAPTKLLILAQIWRRDPLALRGGMGSRTACSRPRPRPWVFEIKAKGQPLAFKARAMGLRGQGHGPVPSRPRPWVFETKAMSLRRQGQRHGSSLIARGEGHGSSRSQPKPLAFIDKIKAMGMRGKSRPRPLAFKAKAVGLRETKAKAMCGLRGQSQGRGSSRPRLGHGSSRPRQRPWAVGLRGQGHGPVPSRPRPWVFETKAMSL